MKFHTHIQAYSYILVRKPCKQKNTNPKNFNVFKNDLNIKMLSKTISVFCISCSESTTFSMYGRLCEIWHIHVIILVFWYRNIFKIECTVLAASNIRKNCVTHSSSRLALEHIWIQVSTTSFYTCANTMKFSIFLVHLLMLSIHQTAKCWQNLNSNSAVCLEGMKKTIKKNQSRQLSSILKLKPRTSHMGRSQLKTTRP